MFLLRKCLSDSIQEPSAAFADSPCRSAVKRRVEAIASDFEM
jgi:hypothetical protein